MMHAYAHAMQCNYGAKHLRCYKDDDDDDDSEGYESSKDPFPCEPRQRPTEDELDKDFDPQEKVRIRP
jgi:hypothetical protein